MLKMLDCFCGMGGVSDGFALEGYDVTGIDIVDAPKMLGYKHRFIQADMLTLKGEDFRGYDVVWGSPPCRDFSLYARIYGKTWKKNPVNPEKGLELVNCFLKFVENANPQFWIMENVFGLKKYFNTKSRFTTNLRCGSQVKQKNQQMVRSFWGNFPNFLLPKENSNIIMGDYTRKSSRLKGYNRKQLTSSVVRAKIPLACSQAFARACKEKLLEVEGNG